MILRTLAARIPLLVPLVLPTLFTLAAASNLGFLESSAVAQFKKNDYELMAKNIEEVLESQAPHARQEWNNPKTKSRGYAEVSSEFTTTDGAPCKRLRVSNEAGGVKSEATYPMCHYEGRGWLLHPDAVPAQESPSGTK